MNLIVDGSNLLHRSYWVNSKSKNPLKNGEIFIFLRTLKSYIRKFECSTCYVCWDKKLLFPSTNFRKETTDVEYKANRADSADVYENEDVLDKFLDLVGVKNMYPRIMEADDVMAWLSITLSDNNMIVTSDADLLQMVNHRTSYFHPGKKQVVTVENFETFTGVRREEYLIYKCILGDISDNIVGWKGYGPVKAKKAATHIFNDPNNIKEYPKHLQDILIRNNELMNLEIGYHLAGEEEAQSYAEQLLISAIADIDKFAIECERYSFNDFLKNLDDWRYLFSEAKLTW